MDDIPVSGRSGYDLNNLPPEAFGDGVPVSGKSGYDLDNLPPEAFGPGGPPPEPASAAAPASVPAPAQESDQDVDMDGGSSQAPQQPQQPSSSVSGEDGSFSFLAATSCSLPNVHWPMQMPQSQPRLDMTCQNWTNLKSKRLLKPPQ